MRIEYEPGLILLQYERSKRRRERQEEEDEEERKGRISTGQPPAHMSLVIILSIKMTK
jgi:hypothetical protein